MKSFCKAVLIASTIVFPTNSLWSAGFSGLFSCSSNTKAKPITYMFNENLMVRDDDKSQPFEHIATLSSGQMIFVGKVMDLKSYQDLKKTWFTTDKDMLDFFLQKQLQYNHEERLLPLFMPIDKKDYVFHFALMCEIHNKNPAYKTVPIAPENTKPFANADRDEKIKDYLEKIDPADIDLSKAKDCEWSTSFVKNQGITDLKSYFVARNDSLSKKMALETRIVSVSMKGTVWESHPFSEYDKTIKYNCTVLQMDIPKIEPSPNPVTKEGSI